MIAETCWMDTPIGVIRLESDTDRGVTSIDYDDSASPDRGASDPGPPVSASGRRLLTALEAYFRGERGSHDLPTAARGTPFQKKVWKALMAIPYGETRTYGEIAASIGAPTATRAVGAACGRNPLAIIVPCHRVVGRDGSLTGYAGGIDRKRWLLAHEQRYFRAS